MTTVQPPTYLTEVLTVERRHMPPVPTPGVDPVDRWDTFAVVRCGDIYGEVERFCYWDPSDNRSTVEVVFEARIYGLPDHAGGCDVYAADSGPLRGLSMVSTQLAALLAEVRK